MVQAILFLAFCVAVVLPLPVWALDRTQLAIIVNTLDPLSVRIGDYYAARRKISFQNYIRVSFPPRKTVLTREEFDAIEAEVDRQTLPNVQAYAITWAAPYRVECMSITTAFAFGFDRAFCAEGCKPTRPSPYFDSPVTLPFAQLKMRPTMAIAAVSLEQAKALIEQCMVSGSSAIVREPAARARAQGGCAPRQERRPVLLHRYGHR